MSNIQAFLNTTTSTQGYCAYDENQDKIILSFRGTQDSTNWLYDIKILRDEYKHCPGCKVHSGFYSGFLSVYEQATSCIKQMIKDHPNSEIVVTGHSYGGALATIAAMEISTFISNKDLLYIYTFGAPRVGNEEFSKQFNNNIKNSFRVVNMYDIVPHVPSTLQNMFMHVGKEIWFYDQNNFKICENTEDVGCSYNISPIKYSIKNHLDYLGMYTGCTEIYLEKQTKHY